MEAEKIVSTKNAEHYNWGQKNDGWHLLKNDQLSVIEELMHPYTTEQLHYHTKAQQVFYILSGRASFEVAENIVQLGPGDSLHVPAGTPHKIFNEASEALRFIVISSPKSHNDRIEL